ncbi:MAG: agmatine deiminase [Spirochaetales bacterium]|nr:agmatine deiminase [Spirochaetales bacterium]
MACTVEGIPRSHGFRMPGEFEPHRGCWMLWPERRDNWRLGAKPAEQAFTEVASAIARFEPVTMGVSAGRFRQACACLPPEVRVVEMSCNDSWMRDVGPTFVVNDSGGLRLVDWQFNAWGGLNGGLYFPWDQDCLVACKVGEIEAVDRYRAPLVLEGGAIHVDGDGTLITTEQCLLNPNRNPGLDRREIEELLREYLDVRTVIWLGQGVFNDETDGHVDNLCCFVRPGVVALSWTEDRSDPQYPISTDALKRLETATDARGRRLQVHKIHQPDPVLISREECLGVDRVEGTLPRREGDRLAASYINFYIANGAVIAPQFGDARDPAALAALAGLFPDREVVGVYAREILLGGGNIHCITQQQPLGGTRREGRAG